ncbi:MAG: PP2C family serine/threonine-protein phosphatase [Microcystis panniformis]
MWKTLCQSVVGSFHVQTGLPCQDYGAYKLLGQDVLIGAVADGAGSAKHSDLGAKITVEAALQFLEENLKKTALAATETEAELKEIFWRLLAYVQQILQKEAEKEQLDINDLATTLLVVLVTSKRLAAMQIGDGFIVFKPLGGNYQLLLQPDKGEYINETTFVTSSNAVEDMQIKVLTEPVAFICVATDGVEKVSIDYKNWQPFPPFFQPLEEYLQQTETPLQEDLKEFLEREDLNKLTTDDKTLLLAFCLETGFV